MKTQNGFTLVELMITIVVLSILLAVGIPSFRSSIQNNRATALANDLLGSINLARSEAIKRGMRVTLCSSTNQTSCAGSTNWATGWIMFADVNSNGAFNDDGDTTLCEVDASNDPTEDCIIKVFETPKGNPDFTGTTVANVQYLPSGAPGSAGTFNLKLPDCSGNQARTITINTVGRASSAESACP